jgi:hypothetical protein
MPTSSMKSAVLQLRKVLLRDVAGLTDSQLLDSFVAECASAGRSAPIMRAVFLVARGK